MTRVALLIGAWLVLLAAILGTGYQNNHLSCVRSNAVRQSQLYEEASIRHAATARFRSAWLERFVDPRQYLVDRNLAAAFLSDAKGVHVPLLDCGSLFPGTR